MYCFTVNDEEDYDFISLKEQFTQNQRLLLFCYVDGIVNKMFHSKASAWRSGEELKNLVTCCKTVKYTTYPSRYSEDSFDVFKVSHSIFSYSSTKSDLYFLFLEGQNTTCHSGPWVKICCALG